MSFVEAKELIDIFSLLNESNIEYILLRNINQEVPYRLQVGKDIDILTHKQEESKLIHFFSQHGYEKIVHPLEHNVFLYGVDKFVFLHNVKNDIIFDLNYQIAVRSCDAGQWIPLDQEIQESAWKNKRFEQYDNSFGYWTLSYEDEFICLIARSIFDKKEFQRGYIKRIEELQQYINMDYMIKKLSMIFFKFAPYLLAYILEKKYADILENYFKFKEY